MFSFFYHLFGSCVQLLPFEQVTLDAVQERLSSESAAILKAQRAHINKVQRHSGGKEVNLYHMSWGRACFKSSLKFRNYADELLIGKVVLVRTDASTRALTAEVWLVNGRLFSITFNHLPQIFISQKSSL